MTSNEIRIVEFQNCWQEKFVVEAALLQSALGDVARAIHHIGSTSVPGLAAKPIIDILMEVPGLSELDNASIHLPALGYEIMGEFGIPGRRYFRKGQSPRTHRVHAFEAGDRNIVRHLAFRDYLTHHPEVADQYVGLKRSLANRYRQDNEGYCRGKEPFIRFHENRALDWYLNTQSHCISNAQS